MKWQVKYAIENIAEQPQLTPQHIEEELIEIAAKKQPDVLAAIASVHEVNLETAKAYVEKYPGMDFLCGYRKTCIWHGDTIQYLEQSGVGWGSAGTLLSAALEGNANTAAHKTFAFSDRLLRQYGQVREVTREFDRIHEVVLRSGKSFRIGMIDDYEPTADAVRTLWERFGPVDFVWNINPNGNPSPEAIDAGEELGCKVMKWAELKEQLRTA